MIEFSKFLATIKIDVPITLNMDELKREEPDEEELRKIFEEMEFRTLIDRVFIVKRKRLRQVRLQCHTTKHKAHFSVTSLHYLTNRALHHLHRLHHKAISLQNLKTRIQETEIIQISHV